MVLIIAENLKEISLLPISNPNPRSCDTNEKQMKQTASRGFPGRCFLIQIFNVCQIQLAEASVLSDSAGISSVSAGSSTFFTSISLYFLRPVPAGISLPIITFSLSPIRWSTLPFIAASVRTFVVSWKEAAERNDSV